MGFTQDSPQKIINDLIGNNPTDKSIQEAINTHFSKPPNWFDEQSFFNACLGLEPRTYPAQKALFELLKNYLGLTGSYTQYDMQDLYARMKANGITPSMLLFLNLPGLVAYYPLNEDSGAVAYNHAPATKGTLDGTITGATVGQAGKVGKAYSFDGIDDNVDLGSSADLVAGLDSFSFGTLVFLQNSTTGRQVIASRSSASTDGYDIVGGGQNGSSNRCAARVRSGSTQFDVFLDGVSVSTWHLLVCVVDRVANTINLYSENNVTSPIDITGLGSITNSQNPCIAKRGTTYYPGTMQHAFFVRRAISQSEITKMAQIAGLA